MKPTNFLFLFAILAAILSAGCPATTQSIGGDDTGVPPRPANATYPGWEHYCARIDGTAGSEDAVAKLLRKAGKQGWELVTIDLSRAIFCFKRPLVGDTAKKSPKTSAPPEPKDAALPDATDE